MKLKVDNGTLRKHTLILFLLTALSFFAGNLHADPQILGMSIDPPQPGFGDTVTIRLTYCAQGYNDAELAIAISSNAVLQPAALTGIGQVFVVYGTKTGSCSVLKPPTSQPAGSPGGEIGCQANPQPGASSWNCTLCGGSTQGVTFYREYTVRVPDAENYPGCNVSTLYLHAGMKDNNLNEGEWETRDACTSETLSWPMPLLPADFEIHKRAEGVLQDPGDLVVFSIDFEYANGPLTITDDIPAGLELVSWGPANNPPTVSASGPSAGATSGSFSWTFPDRTGDLGKADGTVWMLYRMPTDLPDGTVITNSADGTMNSNVKTATTNVTVGSVALSLVKSQEQQNVEIGDNVTYYLEYQINGSALKVFAPFDDLALGSYTNPTPPTGWMYRPEGGKTGTWTIEDPCSTGDSVIRGSVGSTNYPGLLNTSYEFCLGTIVTDVMIDPGNEAASQGYEGSDALVIIRDNGETAPGMGMAYGLVISIDENPGGIAGGNLSFQACTSGCNWYAVTDPPFDIVANKWYRAKIEATADCTFRAKVWPKGDPEPGWMMNWTDPSCVTCASDTFYAGVGEQGGAEGVTEDSYNNFFIYEPRTSADTHVYDTIPTGVIYGGQQGPYPLSTGAPKLDWSLGTITDEGGTFTWWGQVDTCDPITNKSTIIGTGVAAVDSNEVVTIPVCPTPIITLDKSYSPAGPLGSGDAVTWTLHVCNDAASGAPANPLEVWDPIPGEINYMGMLTPGGSYNGSEVRWDVVARHGGPLLPGQCEDFQWWGTVIIVYNPFVRYENIFAYVDMTPEERLIKRVMTCNN